MNLFKNKAERNELRKAKIINGVKNRYRITEVTNGLNEKTFSVQKHYIGNYRSKWRTEIMCIDTYENALKMKTDLEKGSLEHTIIQVDVVSR